MKKMIVIGLCVGGLALVTAICQAQVVPPVVEGGTYPGALPAAWGMTITEMPPATLTTWLNNWNANLTGNYNNYRGPTCEGAVGEDLDWLLTPLMEGYYYGYMATGDTTYVAMFQNWADIFIARAFTEPDGYPGWPRGPASMAPYYASTGSTEGASGTPVDSLDLYYADSFLGEAAVFRVMALMAYQMIHNPGLSATYGAKGASYLALAETIYQKWMARGGWRATTVGGVDGEITVVLPYGMDPATGFTTWTADYATRNNAGNGFSHPDNKANEVARWMLAMYDATGDAQYLTHAQKWFALMKWRMSAAGDLYGGVDPYGNIIWNYWQPAGPWDYVATAAQASADGHPIGQPKLWIGTHPNNGYYQLDTLAIAEAFEHGVVFAKADIDALVVAAKNDWWGQTTTYLTPASLQAGMAISVYPASGTATQINACFPNSLTSAPISAGVGALSGTIVSVGANNVVVQPAAGNNVTITTNGSTLVQMLRMWTAMAPYDPDIQTYRVGSETASSLSGGWDQVWDAPYWLMLQSELLLEAGSVQVTIGPAGAVSAGAQWNLDGGASQTSGATLTNVPVGSHTVDFSTVSGWTTPAAAPVTVVANTTASITGTYVQQLGSLTVTLLPAAAVTAGAQWSVDGGTTWQASGATVSGLAVGGQTVSFNAISGWDSPASAPVTIVINTTTSPHRHLCAADRQPDGDAAAGGRGHRRRAVEPGRRRLAGQRRHAHRRRCGRPHGPFQCGFRMDRPSRRPRDGDSQYVDHPHGNLHAATG